MPMTMTVAAISTVTTMTMRRIIPMTTIPTAAPREVQMTVAVVAAAAARGLVILEVILVRLMNWSALVVGRVLRALIRIKAQLQYQYCIIRTNHHPQTLPLLLSVPFIGVYFPFCLMVY